MLNWNIVLNYVKSRVQLPSGYLEKTDSELQSYIEMVSIPDFSTYFPDDEYAAVLVDNDYYKGVRSGDYKFYDSEDLTIIGIKNCYFPITDLAMSGHPLVGPTDLSGATCWLLDVFKSRLFAKFTDWSFSWIFTPPNNVKIMPYEQCTENFIVHYEREQPTDLRRIPGSLKRSFMDLCAADVMVWIGGLRSMYTETSTPFGNIPLRGEELMQQGNEIKDRLRDLWREETIPPVIIEVY